MVGVKIVYWHSMQKYMMHVEEEQKLSYSLKKGRDELVDSDPELLWGYEGHSYRKVVVDCIESFFTIMTAAILVVIYKGIEKQWRSQLKPSSGLEKQQ